MIETWSNCDSYVSFAETTATWSKRAKKESATTIVEISLELPPEREVGADGKNGGNKELVKGCDKLFKGSLKRNKGGKWGEASPYQYYLLPISLYLSASASAPCFISVAAAHQTSISSDEDESKSWDCFARHLYWSILTLAGKFTFKGKLKSYISPFWQLLLSLLDFQTLTIEEACVIRVNSVFTKFASQRGS